MIQEMSPERLWSQLVARAWADEGLKQRLLSDPRAVLLEHGFDVPEGMEIRVLQDTPDVQHLVLPLSPEGELLDEELVGTAVADSFSGICGICGGCGCGSGGCGRCRCD